MSTYLDHFRALSVRMHEVAKLVLHEDQYCVHVYPPRDADAFRALLAGEAPSRLLSFEVWWEDNSPRSTRVMHVPFEYLDMPDEEILAHREATKIKRQRDKLIEAQDIAAGELARWSRQVEEALALQAEQRRNYEDTVDALEAFNQRYPENP